MQRWAQLKDRNGMDLTDAWRGSRPLLVASGKCDLWQDRLSRRKEGK